MMHSLSTHQSNQQFAKAVMQSEDEYARYLPMFKGKKVALIGYGVTGKSAAEFLLSIGTQIDIYDKQLSLSAVSEFANRFATNVSFYQFNESIDFFKYDYLVVSPGVNLQQSNIDSFKGNNPNKVFGDIELFCLAFNAINEHKIKNGKPPTKLVVVTGSNGKSTVVDMLFKAIAETDIDVALGGNFGIPALCLLKESHELIVLELSSFQLESTHSLKPDIACVLNITDDHLDRHLSLSNYATIKRSIYNNAKHLIVNKDDVLTYPNSEQLINSSLIEISLNSVLDSPNSTDSKLSPIRFDGETIYYKNRVFISRQDILQRNKFANTGNFQLFNMQVVLACAHILHIDVNVIQKSLLLYTGLRHRFETVQRFDMPFKECQQSQTLIENNVQSITWINDSKATNIGACSAAIDNLVSNKAGAESLAILLIAGGDAKGATIESKDVQALAVQIKQHVVGLTLLGKDANLFASMSDNSTKVESLQQAVQSTFKSLLNMQFSVPTDVVILLSPGCASIDMFDNYQHRGDVFVEQVKQVGRLCNS